MIAEIIYVLCALTSVGCALLLLRSYRANKSPLIFWTGVFFALLGLSNILLVIDLIVIPTGADLSLLRTIVTAVAHLLLIVGLTSKSS